MHIGALILRMRLPENHSLKGKRQVLKSLIARLHNKFNVSAAEVSDHDSWQIAALAVTCVANDARHVDEMLASVIAFIQNERLDAEILDYETDVFMA